MALASSSVGKVYQPMLPDSLVTFIQERDTLRPHIDHMLDCLRFSTAKVDNTINLKTLEKVCISLVGKEKLANQRGGNVSVLQVSNIGDPVVAGLFIKT
jgi:hypothetical protein